MVYAQMMIKNNIVFKNNILGRSKVIIIYERNNK